MLLKGTLISNMFVLTSNWPIYLLSHLMRKCFVTWGVSWTFLMLQTSARLTRLHARAWAYIILPWYTWHVILYHGILCSLALHLTFCRYLEVLHSTRLPSTPIISNLVMTKYPQPLLLMEGRRQQKHILDTYLNFTIGIVSYHVLPCVTNPCRRT